MLASSWSEAGAEGLFQVFQAFLKYSHAQEQITAREHGRQSDTRVSLFGSSCSSSLLLEAGMFTNWMGGFGSPLCILSHLESRVRPALRTSSMDREELAVPAQPSESAGPQPCHGVIAKQGKQLGCV